MIADKTQKSIYLHAVEKAVRNAEAMPRLLALSNTDEFGRSMKFFIHDVTEAIDSWCEMYKAEEPQVERHICAYAVYARLDYGDDLLIDKRYDFTTAVRNVLYYLKIARRLFGVDELANALYNHGLKEYSAYEYLSCVSEIG